jgi:hypothetical protein
MVIRCLVFEEERVGREEVFGILIPAGGVGVS